MPPTLKPERFLNEEEFEFELRLLFGILRTRLTDAEWDNIKSLSGFEDAARTTIDSALRDYWEGLIHQTVDPETKKDIAKARTLIPRLVVALLELSENPDLFKGRVLYFDKSIAEQREQLMFAAHTLDKADDILGMAEERIEHGPGRKGYGPLQELVSKLDELLFEQHNTTLKRSTNRMSDRSKCTGLEYVIEIARIAYPTVADATVDTALKEHIKQKGTNFQDRSADGDF